MVLMNGFVETIRPGIRRESKVRTPDETIEIEAGHERSRCMDRAKMAAVPQTFTSIDQNKRLGVSRSRNRGAWAQRLLSSRPHRSNRRNRNALPGKGSISLSKNDDSLLLDGIRSYHGGEFRPIDAIFTRRASSERTFPWTSCNMGRVEIERSEGR